MSKPFKAFLLDTLLLFLFVLPIFLWFSIIEEPLAKHINWNLKISDNLNSIISLGLISGYYIIILGYLLSKDALNSSFGKRKYQLKIIDRKTGKEVHWFKKILRNLTFLIPFAIVLEFIFKIITPKARFGDMLFDTEIRESSKVILD